MRNYSYRFSFTGICALFLIVWSITPFMEVDMIWRVLALGASGLWFLLSMNSGMLFRDDNGKALIFLAAVVIIAFIQTFSINGILKQIAIIILVIFYVMYNYYKSSDGFLSLSWYVPIVLILLAIFNYRSGQALAINPQIARRLVRDDESIYVYLRQGVGGYSLIYPQVITFPALLTWTIKAFRHNKFLSAIGVAWIVTYVRFLLAAGYSIAIVASLIGLFVMYFYKGKNVFGLIVVSILLFVGGILAIVNSDSLRALLLDIFDGTAVAKKINDLMLSVQYEAGQGSIWDRIIAYQGSFNTIFRYPVIGGLFWASGGGHSAVLDMFAKYGIWGGLIYTKMIYAVPTYYKSVYGNTSVRSVANATFSTVVFVSILDSFTYAFMGMLLIILPIVFETLLFWSGEKDESSLDC